MLVVLICFGGARFWQGFDPSITLVGSAFPSPPACTLGWGGWAYKEKKRSPWADTPKNDWGEAGLRLFLPVWSPAGDW